jgi:hypothetical protein
MGKYFSEGGRGNDASETLIYKILKMFSKPFRAKHLIAPEVSDKSLYKPVACYRDMKMFFRGSLKGLEGEKRKSLD